MLFKGKMSSSGKRLKKLPPLMNRWAKEIRPHGGLQTICECLDAQYDDSEWFELRFHDEEQNTECSGWHRLNELIEHAARKGLEVFSPGRRMTPEQWAEITTLPKTINRLKTVKHLIMYGSNLVRIPPEIGEMSSLEEFTPYTSQRLHWFPYEILRCKSLRKSTISTRALYGNYKYRPPFPRLPQLFEKHFPKKCSICDMPLGDAMPIQLWISLPVGTDVVPLLVHACSETCVTELPIPPQNYVQYPHTGGLDLEQPDSAY